MRGLRSALNHNRTLAALLVALALFVRAVVPGGWMLESAERSVTLTLCADASGTPKQVVVPLGGKHDASKDQAGKHSPCAFAGMAAALDPAFASADLLSPATEPVRQPAALSVAIGRGLAAPPPPQTGPPVIA